MLQYIHSQLSVKDVTTFKRSRFVSRFPFLDIETHDTDVYFTSCPFTNELSKFITDIARHAVGGSWIEVNDIESCSTIVYMFDGNGGVESKSVEYDPIDDPDEFIPDDIESVVDIDEKKDDAQDMMPKKDVWV